MSSLSFSTATVELLTAADIEAVEEIERLSNSHPWTERNFHDALASGYLCLIARDHGAVSGFAVARLLVDEAELLLIAVTPAMRRQGVALDRTGGAIASKRCANRASGGSRIKCFGASVLWLTRLRAIRRAAQVLPERRT